MDAVSDVLRHVRMGGAVYLNAAFTAPWSTIGKTDGDLCSAFLPRSERVISYHLLTEGSCWARLARDAGAAIQVNAGELLVVPQGETHILSSAPDLTPVSLAPLIAGHLVASPGEALALNHGGGGTATRLICGFL